MSLEPVFHPRTSGDRRRRGEDDRRRKKEELNSINTYNKSSESENIQAKTIQTNTDREKRRKN